MVDIVYIDSDPPEDMQTDGNVISLLSSPDKSIFHLSSDNLEHSYSDCEIVSQQPVLEPLEPLEPLPLEASLSKPVAVESQKRSYDALSPVNVAAKRTQSAPVLSPITTRKNQSSERFAFLASSPESPSRSLNPLSERGGSAKGSINKQNEFSRDFDIAPSSPLADLVLNDPESPVRNCPDSVPSSPLADLVLNELEAKAGGSMEAPASFGTAGTVGTVTVGTSTTGTTDNTAVAANPESPTPARRSKTTGSLPRANLIATKKPKGKKVKAVKKMTDRKETAKSMICEIEGSLPIASDIEKALSEAEIKSKFTNSPKYDGLVIHLSRTASDTFDEEQDMFVPAATHTEHETTAIAIMDAKVFLEILLDETKHDAYFDNLQQSIAAPTVLYIVQGIQAAIKKSINEHNKVVQTRARAYMGGQQQLAPLAPLKAVNHEVISAAQTKLQVQKGVRVIYSANTAQTTEWVVNLVQDVSLARYQTKYSEQPTVKSGKTDADCVVETLAKIKMITPSVATRIRTEFPNMGALLRELHREGPPALTDKGVVGDRMASSMHALLCATDPDQLV